MKILAVAEEIKGKQLSKDNPEIVNLNANLVITYIHICVDCKTPLTYVYMKILSLDRSIMLYIRSRRLELKLEKYTKLFGYFTSRHFFLFRLIYLHFRPIKQGENCKFLA